MTNTRAFTLFIIAALPAHLSEADLRRVDLSGAELRDTQFTHADTDSTRGLPQWAVKQAQASPAGPADIPGTPYPTRAS